MIKKQRAVSKTEIVWPFWKSSYSTTPFGCSGWDGTISVLPPGWNVFQTKTKNELRKSIVGIWGSLLCKADSHLQGNYLMALQLYCTPVGLRKCTVHILLLKTVIVCLKKRSFSVGLICIMLWKIRREAFLLVWSVFMLQKKAAWNSLCNGDGLPCWASRLAQAFAERSQCHALCCCVEHLWYAFFSWCKKPWWAQP